MSNGNGDTLPQKVDLILKVELVDKQMRVTWGKEINSLLFDRAIRMASLDLDNMILGAQVEQAKKNPPKPITIIKPITGFPETFIDKLRKK